MIGKTATSDPYVLLAGAILKQALSDYRLALKKENCEEANSIKKWLLSEYGQFLSFGQSEYLIEQTEKGNLNKNK